MMKDWMARLETKLKSLRKDGRGAPREPDGTYIPSSILQQVQPQSQPAPAPPPPGLAASQGGGGTGGGFASPVVAAASAPLEFELGSAVALSPKSFLQQWDDTIGPETAESHVVDLPHLRELAFYGIPDQWRSVGWMLLLGQLPPERAKWQNALNHHREAYRSFLEDPQMQILSYLFFNFVMLLFVIN